jgi:hypothetical protein
VTIKKDSIDLGAIPDERYRHLRRILENVIGDTDPTADAQHRLWIVWTLLYIIWYEGRGATSRKQTNGPARGLMQMEPQTLQELIALYVLGSTPGLVANLAAAAGVSRDEMAAALTAFKNAPKPTHNVWPDPAPNDPATKIEQWLLDVDSFGIKLMRYVFRRAGQGHRFPPSDPARVGDDPQSEAHKKDHSEHWARRWKKHFASDTEEDSEKAEFEGRARQVDDVARHAGPWGLPPPTTDSTPPTNTPPPTTEPTPVPPAPRGSCAGMMVLLITSAVCAGLAL